MLVQFGNNWIQKIPQTAKLDEAVIWQSEEFFSSNYFQIGQHVVLLHIQIIRMISNHKYDFRPKLHYTKFNYHFITPILKSYSPLSILILVILIYYFTSF